MKGIAVFQRQLAEKVRQAASQYPSVTLFGPRQSGKTTLAKACFPDYAYANLEHLGTRELAENDPDAFFRRFRPPVVVDEVQRVPSLVSQIQVLIDENRDATGRFILTGSHQTKLSETVSQSLAGRTSVLTLYPPSIAELGEAAAGLSTDALLFRGFMPDIHARGIDPPDWYRNYVQTYLERDVRQMVNVKDQTLFGRFLALLAGRVGRLLNVSALAGEVGVSAPTVSGWISILEASFLVYRLCPWFPHRGKRMVKTPKLYFTEPGLAAHLLGIESPGQLARDPLRGALFENLVVGEALKQRANAGVPPGLWFLRTADGFEIDLLRSSGRTLRPVEIKSAVTWHDSFARQIRAFARDDPAAMSPTVVYDGQDLDLSDGVAVRNVRSFRI